MKILKEAKEDLPISFITDFISGGWETVGYLKADIEAISETYKGTKEIVKYIQDLADAYLICIGQMEALLHNDDYLEYPEESKLAPGDKKPKLDEAVQITISEVPETVEDAAIVTDTQPVIDTSVPAKKFNIEEPCTDMTCADNMTTSIIDTNSIEQPVIASGTPFEYYVDFDDPDMSAPIINPFDELPKQKQA